MLIHLSALSAISRITPALRGMHPDERSVHMIARPSVGGKLAYAKGSYGLRGPLVSFVEAVPRDLMKVTSCQRCGSGNLDHTGIPFRTTPFVRIQKIAPGSAF